MAGGQEVECGECDEDEARFVADIEEIRYVSRRKGILNDIPNSNQSLSADIYEACPSLAMYIIVDGRVVSGE